VKLRGKLFPSPRFKVEATNCNLETDYFFPYYQEVRVFKYPRFSHFADKEGITDNELLEIVDQLEGDQADANLGGDVFKVRVARQGEGKSGGYRAIVYFRNEFRTFFVYGFPKSDRDNINKKELKRFKEDAKSRLSFTDEQIRELLQNRSFIEIIEED
jgi:hypothetical protein